MGSALLAAVPRDDDALVFNISSSPCLAPPRQRLPPSERRILCHSSKESGHGHAHGGLSTPLRSDCCDHVHS